MRQKRKELHDFQWDEPAQTQAPAPVERETFTPGPPRPLRQLARLVWLVWTPWLTILFFLVWVRGPLQEPATLALFASWIATGILQVASTFALRRALVRRAPWQIAERGIGHMGYSGTRWKLAMMARDAEIRSDPELREYAERVRALSIAPTAVFLIIMVPTIVVQTLM